MQLFNWVDATHQVKPLNDRHAAAREAAAERVAMWIEQAAQVDQAALMPEPIFRDEWPEPWFGPYEGDE